MQIFSGVVKSFPPVTKNAVADAYAVAPLESFTMETAYETDPGTMAIPLSAPDSNGNTVRIVQLSAPRTTKVVAFVAERLGAWPEIPNQVSPDPTNEIPGPSKIAPTAPRLLPDGQNHMFRISGFWTYFLKKPVNTATGLRAGVAPDDTTSPVLSNFPLPTMGKNLFG